MGRAGVAVDKMFHVSDEGVGVSAAYGQAKKRGASKEKKEGHPERGGDRAKEGGQTSRGF